MYGCNSHSTNHDTKFDNFHYSWDSLVSAKLFVYSRIDNKNLKAYHYYQVYSHDGMRYLISSNRGDGNIRDSSKSKIEGSKLTLLETYMIMKNPNGIDSRVARGEIIENVNEDLVRESKIKYVNPFYNKIFAIIQVKEVFDTLISTNYKNTTYQCLCSKSKVKVTSKNNIPFLHKSFEKSMNSVFAKDLGLIQYTITDKLKRESVTWRLDTILNYTDSRQ